MQTKTKRFTTLVCFICSLALLVCTLPPATVQAETLAERIARLKGELSELSSSIKDQEAVVTNATTLLNQYKAEQALILEVMEATKQSIDTTRGNIEIQQGYVAEKRQAILESQELFESRLVAIYKMNNAGVLSTLLTVNSYSEFLSVSTNLQVISEHDTALLENLAAEKQALDEELARLDALLADLQGQYDDLNEMAEYYAANIQKQQSDVNNATAKMLAQKEAYGEVNEEYERAQKEMDALLASLKGSNSSDGSVYVGGSMSWPVPGFYNVTCEYGAPDPNGTPHKGMDISSSGIGGAAIVAANDGTVTTAGWHSSYGNYVVIDHSGGIRTLYAHCSSLAVSAGQSVTRDQTIAYVGSTGFSTGNHLHFEVHYNGARQNPKGYLTA